MLTRSFFRPLIILRGSSDTTHHGHIIGAICMGERTDKEIVVMGEGGGCGSLAWREWGVKWSANYLSCIN